MSTVDEKRAFRLSAKLLNRLGRDSAFAKRFDKNPGAAMKELFPKLAKIPTGKINEELADLLRQMAKAPKGSVYPALPATVRSSGIVSLLQKSQLQRLQQNVYVATKATMAKLVLDATRTARAGPSEPPEVE